MDTVTMKTLQSYFLNATYGYYRSLWFTI